MYYCVRCGDKIEKDELVCDKCGLHFTVVQGDSTIVYINRTTSPNVYPNASQSVNTAATTVASAAAVTAAPAAPAPQAPATPVANRPLTKAEKKAIKKANKQKKKEGKRARYGWVIALTLLASGAVFVVTLIVLLIIGGLFGFILFFPTDSDAPEVVAYEQSLLDAKENSTTTYQSASSSDNTNSNSDAFLSKAIREPFVTLKGDGTDTATVMIYMNGSDLESKFESGNGRSMCNVLDFSFNAEFVQSLLEVLSCGFSFIIDAPVFVIFKFFQQISRDFVFT